MTILRTAVVTFLIGFAGLPALADSFGIVDLPRLEFPAGGDITRACTDHTAPVIGCTPVNG